MIQDKLTASLNKLTNANCHKSALGNRTRLEDLGTRWCWTDRTKRPRGLDGNCVNPTRPQEWMTFEEALTKTSETPHRTLGLLMNPDDNLVCIDLDNCLDEQGNIKDPVMRELINMADSYTEVSMSGRGLHMFIRSELTPKVPIGGSPEIYDGKYARYIAVTGKYYEGFRTVRTSDEALKKAIELNANSVNPQDLGVGTCCYKSALGDRICLEDIDKKTCSHYGGYKLSNYKWKKLN